MLEEQVLAAEQGILSPPHCLVRHKQLLVRGPCLAHPLRREGDNAHPAATGIWGGLRRGSND